MYYKIAKTNVYLEKLCRDNNFIYIDNGFIDMSLLADGLHFNDVGTSAFTYNLATSINAHYGNIWYVSVTKECSSPKVSVNPSHEENVPQVDISIRNIDYGYKLEMFYLFCAFMSIFVVFGLSKTWKCIAVDDQLNTSTGAYLDFTPTKSMHVEVTPHCLGHIRHNESFERNPNTQNDFNVTPLIGINTESTPERRINVLML